MVAKGGLLYAFLGVKVTVLSIHHVSLVVANTEKSVAFYTEVLDLEVCADRPELNFPGAWLQVGDQQIHLLEVPNPDPVENRPEHGGRDRHLAMSVNDISKIEKRLESRGLGFTRSRSGRPAIFCRDPDGNGLELIEVAS